MNAIFQNLLDCKSSVTDKEIGFMWAHFRKIGHEINTKAAADEKNVAMNETFVNVE